MCNLMYAREMNGLRSIDRSVVYLWLEFQSNGRNRLKRLIICLVHIYIYIRKDMVDTGKFRDVRFDLEGSTSRLVPSAVQTFRIMSWKYSLRSTNALQMFELSAIGTAISISDGYIDYYFG